MYFVFVFLLFLLFIMLFFIVYHIKLSVYVAPLKQLPSLYFATAQAPIIPLYVYCPAGHHYLLH